MAEGFDRKAFEKLARMEENNFWFQGRNEIILWGIDKYLANKKSFFELGCGTGFVAQGISTVFPSMLLVGGELFREGLFYAKSRSSSSEFIQLDAKKLPFRSKFSAVGAFDVIEHIEEDQRVLSELYNILLPDGFLFVTVPQHKWLWSQVDEQACHVRRYSKEELHKKVIASGFKIVRSTSFVSSLLPFMVFSRLFVEKLRRQSSSGAELEISPILNKIFEIFIKLDLFLIRLGFNLPFGGSRLLIAKKESES
jgi:SAM-dependent methyltransferase